MVHHLTLALHDRNLKSVSLPTKAIVWVVPFSFASVLKNNS